MEKSLIRFVFRVNGGKTNHLICKLDWLLKSMILENGRFFGRQNLVSW